MKNVSRNLSLILLLMAAFAPVAAQRANEGKLKNDLSKLRSERRDASRKLRTTRTKVRAVRGDIRLVDERLNTVSSRLESTSQRLEESRREQERLASDLVQATQRLGERREQVRARLRRMYMQGHTSALSGLVQSKSLGELASRQYLYERLRDQDRKVFEEYRSLREQVAERKERQDRLVVEVSRLKRDQEMQQHSLEVARSEKQELLQDLRGQQQELEKMLAQLEAEEAAIEARLAALARRGSSLPAFTGRFMRPVNAGVTSGFGMRFHPILKVNRLHKGVDFGAPTGTPIYAAADGIVITAGYSNGYGNMVILDHGGGVTTLYGHASRLYVSEGQRVSKGERIAAVGSTGLSTGPHLHWEVRINGQPVNPLGRL
ncbi:MAG TPA: peptidoglycan DD-metalloendopeptidase family protein [Fimbriimonadaceae bacterium]|nr:peptidoglycan DD-metalloendopeptidase family protein [Fimbriimonadaceae bacterium]